MPEKFRNRYRNASPRASWWDYGWDGAYFITMCTRNRHPYFGAITNGKMHFSPQGILADRLWYEIAHHSKHCALGPFIVMPDHVHGVLVLKNNMDNIVNGDLIRNDGPNQNDDGDQNVNRDQNVNGDQNVGTRHALSLRFDPNDPNDPNESFESFDPMDSLKWIESTESPEMESLKTESPVPEWPGWDWWQTHLPRPRFRNQGKNTISSIVGSYKSAVTKQAHLLGYEMAWQPRFYDHIIRDADEWRRIKFYIQNNVKNWGKR